MADGFEAMIDSAVRFFTELGANNEKAWFEPRKDHYITEIRKPAELFADLMADDLSRLTGQGQAGKVFRIYRDVRFSKDKTPYNTHLHILWSAGQPMTPAFFFAADPAGVWVGMGLVGLSGDSLTRYRQILDRDGDSISDEIEGLARSQGASLSSFGPEPLKRVPKPYDPDHPHGDLLKRKGLALGANLPPDWRDVGLVKAVSTAAAGYLPLWRLFADA